MNKNRTQLRVLALSALLLMSAPAFSNDNYGLPMAQPESLGMSTEKLGAIKANLQPLIDEHKVDLLVMYAKDEDQLAMHGRTYPLAVELRHIPLLML